MEDKKYPFSVYEQLYTAVFTAVTRNRPNASDYRANGLTD